MEQTLADTPPAQPQKRPWPLSSAFLLAGFRPGELARRTEHVSLRRAYLVHVLGVLVSTAIIVTAVDAVEVGSFWGELWGDFERHPDEFLFGVVGTALGIEAGHFLVACALTCWGACVEPIRSSLSNAVRCTWLHTACFPLIILAVCLVIVPLAISSKSWHQQHPYPSYTPPILPPSATPLQMEQYNQQFSEYFKSHQAAVLKSQEGEPWYVYFVDEIVYVTVYAGCWWWLWSLLAAIGARRQPLEDCPPICEFCGYSLTGLPPEARCPECGQLLVDSLGPHVRPGVAWQRRPQIGRVNAFVLTAVKAILRPRAFGRDLQMYPSGRDHRWFALVMLVITFLAAVSGTLYFASVHGHWDASLFYDVAPCAGSLIAPVVLLITLAAAGLTALGMAHREKRNVGPAAIQAACYLMPYLAMMTACGFFLAAELGKRHIRVRDLARVWQIAPDLCMLVLWATPMLLLAAWYFRLLARITYATRYANR